jgi:hypothetical protein
MPSTGPFRREVDPVRILPDDKGGLLGTGPSLELRLADESFVDIVVRFPIEQTDDFVARAKAFEVVKLVLEDAAVKIAADVDIESAGKAAHDVGAIVFAFSGHGVFSDVFF